ncbi:MAG TPA: flagellar biosynthesis protein FlhF [Rubrivivax sp.]|nr:flagellar biosynthesis protein FlhF [Rubrivivax sp.]
MNLKRFTAKTSREALALVKAAFGEEAIVMSTKPCEGGVEVLAMAPESLHQLERVAAQTPAPAIVRAAAAPRDKAPAAQRLVERKVARVEPSLEAPLPTDVEQDLEQLQMSTLSFQDYVRQRMLKRRDAERAAEAAAEPSPPAAPPVVAPIEAARLRHEARNEARQSARQEVQPKPSPMRDVPVLRDEVQLDEPVFMPATPPQVAGRGDQIDMQALAARSTSERAENNARAEGERTAVMTELRSMRGLIEQRFGALAFMEKLQRQPRQAQLAQRLLDTGFSPALIRKMVESLPAAGDETTWAANVLERNLPTGEREPALEDLGGIYALIGATGVGKTTSTAKLAAAFATRHGASNLGLITLDAYRVGAQEQLRTYGRILGVPVHTAHDRASLEDLLDLLSAKKMVLIDTAGMAQRDERTRELLEMLSHRAVNRLLVINASAQGETIEDQLAAYAASNCRGVVLSKLDEAVKLGPALDSMIRHKLKVLAVANGQRVPEDWHRLSANALVQRALKGGGTAAWRLDDSDVSLIFAGMPGIASTAQAASRLHA